MKMIRAKRSVVLVRRWLMRARQDLELVPARGLSADSMGHRILCD